MALVVVVVSGCGGRASNASELVLDHVNVIDVVTGEVLVDRQVSIARGRIVGVAPATTSAAGQRGSARVLDLRGRYVIPGLWDMHAHIDTTEQWFFPLAVAAGVTGVRDMGGLLERASTWKQPAPLRPIVVAAGPIVTGAVDDPDPRVVRVTEEVTAVGVVDSCSTAVRIS